MVNARQWTLVICCVVAASTVPLTTISGQETDEEQGVRLSLADTLRTALANNLDLVSARIDPQVSELNVQSQEAIYDVNVSADVNMSRNTSEVFDPIDELFASQEFVNSSVGFSQTLPFGPNYSVTLDGGRFGQPGLEDLNNVDLGDLDPESDLFFLLTGLGRLEPVFYSANLGLDFSVPLARGFGKEAQTESLVLARSDLAISRERLRAAAHRVMVQVEGAYWEVLANREEAKIARRSLQRAEELLDRNRKKVEAGTLAPIEVTEAEAGVASQVELVILAETSLENAEDQLLLLLATPASDPMWEQHIIPTDKPSFEPVEIDLAETIASALERRPEIINERRTLADSELSERLARKRTRPSIDLTGSVRTAGDSDEPDDFELDRGSDGIFDTEDDIKIFPPLHLGDAIRELPNFKTYDWRLGFSLSYAIFNREAKASYAIARLGRERVQAGLRNLEQSIRVDVRRAVRSVESGAQRVEAARLSLELQRKKLDAEKRKFDNGTSTSFEVLAFQDDLANAEVSEIRAALAYARALTELESAKGTLLEARGLTLGK